MTGRRIDVTFVSRNPGKVREIRRVLSTFGVRVRWLRRNLAEPQAASLEEVVRAKLGSVPNLRGYVLVEDSGLFISSLGGFPGVYSAHFLELWGFDPILELLRRRPRGAHFRTVAGLRKGRETHYFSGQVRGTIAKAPAGTQGFGYDPIFVPRGWSKSFAEASVMEKNGISHRARALRKVGQYLVAGE